MIPSSEFWLKPVNLRQNPVKTAEIQIYKPTSARIHEKFKD